MEIEREGPTPILDADTGPDENEEAANSERNCDLGELSRQTENVIRENDFIMEGNPNEPNMIEVLK